MSRHHSAARLISAWCLIAAISGLFGCSQAEGPGEFQSFDSLETTESVSGQNSPSTVVTPPSDTDDDSQSTSDASPAAEVPSTPAAVADQATVGDTDGATHRQSGATPATATPGQPADNAGPESATTPAQAPVGTTLPPGGSPTPAQPRQVKILVTERTFQAEGPQKSLRVTYDDIDLLKVLNMEPVTPNAAELMPQWLSRLNGRRILIRGFMYPTFKETGLQAFILARDNQICCFGRDPKIYDLVRIILRKGVTASYIQGRPFDVEGVFRIQPESEDDELYRLYSIDDAVVIDR